MGTAISVERVAQMLLGIAVGVAGIVFVGQALARSVAHDRRRRPRAARPRLHPVGPHGGRASSRTCCRPRSPCRSRSLVRSSVTPVPDRLRAHRRSERRAARRLDGRGARSRRARPPRRRRRDRRGVATERPARHDDATRAPNVVTATVRRRMPLPVGLGTTMAIESGTRPSQRARAPRAARGRRRRARDRRDLHGRRTVSTTPSPTRSGPASRGTPPCSRASQDYTDQVDRLSPAFVEQLRGQRDVGDAAILGRAVLDVDGAGVAVFDVKPVRGSLSLVVVDGRAPASVDEAAIGPATADQLGLHIGDRVTVEGRSERTLQIVGHVALPERGALGLHRGTLDRAGGDARARDAHRLRGADRDGAVRRGPLARAVWTATRRSPGSSARCPTGAARSDRPRCRPSSRT